MTTTPLRETFREVMAGVPTPVTVLTALEQGTPHGTTVGAFASLSMEPPMVVACLDRRSDLLARVRRTGRFGVNVLGSAHSALAVSFAKKGAEKFHGVEWEADNGIPRLAGAPGWIVCDVADLVGGGDHVIVIGTVLAVDTAPVEPLTYHMRSFGTHAPLAASGHLDRGVSSTLGHGAGP
jgi:flavin reductase (DIM6/NTAB) family NADH-FMN oxidoreductase RutF